MSHDAARPNRSAASPAGSRTADPAGVTDDPAGRSVTSEVTRSLHRSTASYELAFAPVIMALLGLWLDRTIGTTPLFTIGLAVLGTAGAAVSVYYSYDRSMRRIRDEHPWNRAARTAGTAPADGGAS